MTIAQYQNILADNLLSEKISDDSESLLMSFVPMFDDSNPEEEAFDRLSIYRNNVILSLSMAIADTFPVIKRLIGDDCFQGAAVNFVRAYPPAEPSLLFYGEGFIDFIRTYPSCSHLGYLSDVSRLEWSYIKAFHAADSTVLDNKQLQQIEPEDLGDCVLKLNPSVQLLQSDWPVDTIWEENIQHQVKTVDLSEHSGCNLVIHRQNLQVQIINLTIECFHFLQGFAQGKSIADAWTFTEKQQHLANREALDDSELSGMLGYLLSLSLFTSVTLLGKG